MKFKSSMIFAVFVAFSFLVVLQPAFAGEPVVDEVISTQVDADATIVAEVSSTAGFTLVSASVYFGLDSVEYSIPMEISSASFSRPDLIKLTASTGKEMSIFDKRDGVAPVRSGPLIC